MAGLIMLVVIGAIIVTIVLQSSISALRRRVNDLEAQVAWLRRAEQPMAPRTPASAASPSQPVSTAPSEPTLSELLQQSPPPSASTSPSPRPRHEPAAATPMRSTAVPPPLPPAVPAPTRPTATASATASQRPAGVRREPAFDPFAVVRRWFTEGNVPVKVGVLVLFAGVAALLKYAVDQGKLHVPIELRLAGVALAAVGGLIFGWRQRDTRRSFGLALQGGAIGVLLLVTFAAFKLYPMISAGAAFGISVALVAGLCVLAVRQESLALAVLGVLAGFLAPIWLSTGEGNHVALFGYYAVLNSGIVAMAWRRPWRLLNLLGFAFTFGIGSLWGALKYRPEDFGSTEPFLLLFCAMYIAIPILYAAAKGPAQRRVFDGSLIFGTPLVAFTLQAAMLRSDHMLLAFCALGLGLLYAALAGLLRRRDTFAELVAPYAVLAVGFSTLAVPLALSARATAAVFALEGAGLVWLGLRQSRLLPQFAGVALQFAAAFAFAYAFKSGMVGPPVLNGVVMTAVLVAIGGFATAFAARAQRSDPLATGAYLWGLVWWLGVGLWEIERSVGTQQVIDSVMLLDLITALAVAEVARRRPAGALHWTVAALLLLPIVFAAWQFLQHGQPLAGLGGIAWLVDVVVAWRALTCLRDNASRSRGVTHIGWWVSISLMLSFAAVDVARHAQVGDAWRFAAAALPWLLVAAVAVLRPDRVATPFGDDFEGWREHLQGAFAVVLAGFFVVGLVREGAPSPLPYIPVFDPVELVQLASLLLAIRFARDIALARPVLAGAGLVLATSIVLRATHHWGDMPWSPAMFSESLVQSSLTVLWSVIGMAAWVAGSRRHRRSLWQVGAVLMAVVLAKLVLIDRQYLGNLLGIGSFIAFGLLCVAVGYLAPVPPRDAETTA